MSFVNVTFTGNIYDTSGNQFSGNEVKYQLYFYKQNDGSSSSIWSSTRLSEYGQYNINLGDSDILSPDGNANELDKVIIAFWTPNTSIKSNDNLLEWCFIETTLVSASTYVIDVQLKGPQVPICDFEVTGATTINENVIAIDIGSHDRHSWEFSGNTMYQEPSRYSQPIFYLMNNLPVDSIDISWGDSTWTNNDLPAIDYYHQYENPNNYDITTYVTNTAGLSASQVFMWSIYYNTPVVDFTIDNDSPNPIGTSSIGEEVTFTNITTDPDSHATIDGWTCDWTIEDGAYTAEYTGESLSYNPTHQFHSIGEHDVTLVLHWYTGFEWTTSTITKTVTQQAWTVSNGLTWTTPIYIEATNTYTPAITGSTSYVTGVNYYIDGTLVYSDLSYDASFNYAFIYSDTHLIQQVINYHNGFNSVTQVGSFNVIMSPIANFSVSDDTCGDIYTSDSEPGKPPIVMYKWKVYLNNVEIASHSGAAEYTFRYNWPTAPATYKICHEITDLLGQTANIIKTFNVTTCKGGSTPVPTGGGFAGGGVLYKERPLPKIKVILKKIEETKIVVNVKLINL